MNRIRDESCMRTESEAGPWDDAVAQLRAWDPAWTESCTRMATNPWRSGVLPRKLVELIGVALNAACTNLNADGTRRHIRAALRAGATRDEVLMILEMASVMSIHSCSLGAPMLLEEAKAAGARPAAGRTAATPACDQMKAGSSASARCRCSPAPAMAASTQSTPCT